MINRHFPAFGAFGLYMVTQALGSRLDISAE
jgi:hypothetical protein